MQLRADAEDRRRDALAVGVRELRQVAGPHQDLDVGLEAAQLRIALERGHEAEMYRIEHRVGDMRECPWPWPCRWRARARRDRRAASGMRIGTHLVPAIASSVRFVEREHEIRARPRAARELLDVAGIDADREALPLERRDRLLEMRKGDIRLAADVDHVGTGGLVLARTRDERLDA